VTRDSALGVAYLAVGVLVLGLAVWAVIDSELAGPGQLVLIPFAFGAGFIAIGVQRLRERDRWRPPRR
jgi:hypothetical protein